MENPYSACICDDDISSIYPHQHIPETADLRIRVKVFSKNGCLFFVDSYICKPWPERLVLSGMMPWTQNINNHKMRIFFRLMIVAALAAANYLGAAAQEPVLKFNQDKKFKIVQFTDTPISCGSVHGPSPICHSENAYTLSL